MKKIFLNLYRYEPEYTSCHGLFDKVYYRVCLDGREYNKLPFVNIWIRRMK